MITATDLNIILAGVVGSTAHGLSLEGQDDTDVMGVYVESAPEALGIGRQDHKILRTAAKGARSGPDDVDEVYYSLRKFGRLAASGNPSILVLLFLNDYLSQDAIGEELVRSRELFLSREAGKRFLGYLRSQRGKLERSRGPGAHRPELVEAHGYDTKYAMHMIRLAYQGIELMDTGSITLPMPEPGRSHCMAVRKGEIDYRRVLTEAGWLEHKLRISILMTELQDHFDVGKVNAKLEWLHLWHWGYE